MALFLVAAALLTTFVLPRDGLSVRLRSTARAARDRMLLVRARLSTPAVRANVRLLCVPARAVGVPGELLSIADLRPMDTATVLLVWSETSNRAGAELEALHVLLRGTGDQIRLLERRPQAVILTAPGAVLRRASDLAPSAQGQLAVAGTRELCIVGRS